MRQILGRIVALCSAAGLLASPASAGQISDRVRFTSPPVIYAWGAGDQALRGQDLQLATDASGCVKVATNAPFSVSLDRADGRLEVVGAGPAARTLQPGEHGAFSAREFHARTALHPGQPRDQAFVICARQGEAHRGNGAPLAGPKPVEIRVRILPIG